MNIYEAINSLVAYAIKENLIENESEKIFMNPVKFYLLTDTHYFEESLGAEGKAFEDYMQKEQYFMKESSAIVKSVFNRANAGTDNSKNWLK